MKLRYKLKCAKKKTNRQTHNYNKRKVIMRKTNAIFWGLALILAGAVLILVQMDIIDFDWNYIWPAVMILLGIMFHVQFFAIKGRSAGVLVPGGILLIYGSFFLYLKIMGWAGVGNLWPVFLLGPGFGLLEQKLFSRGRQGSWIPVIILFAIATFFLVQESFASFSVAAAVALIIVGVIIIIVSFFDKGKKKEDKVNINVDIE